MLAKVFSGTVVGLDGELIEVEVDVAGRGFPTFTLVGLPTKAVDEAKDRVRTAITNSDYEMPDSRITVNLAPADMPKRGAAFDFPIAVGILQAAGYIDTALLTSSIFIGELSLEGNLRNVPGVISIAIMARDKGYKYLFLPAENAHEATFIPGVQIYPVPHLRAFINHVRGVAEIAPAKHKEQQHSELFASTFDFADIRGQEQAKRAMAIAASGFHNIHLKGVPGAGKTMLSRAFPSILPPMDDEEVLEVSKIYSTVGLLPDGNIVRDRPFRSPHHTTSRIGLIGGGSNPHPGEITLAHRGVLFLDELPEFPRITLETLRQPLEDGIVSISRAAGSLTFPSRFILIAASNPCPCGYMGHPTRRCTCHPGAIQNYAKRLSGPLLDRIDIHLDVMPVEEHKLAERERGEESVAIRERVMEARARQAYRLDSTPIKTNGEMTSADIKHYCTLADDAGAMLTQATKTLSLSARSYFRTVKLAQTIADMAASDRINVEHVAEALQYRVKEM